MTFNPDEVSKPEVAPDGKPPSGIPPSKALRSFVNDASIGGVFLGQPSRVLVNGKIVREGQPVDEELGIEFRDVDPEKKLVYFQEKSGAVMAKSY